MADPQVIFQPPINDLQAEAPPGITNLPPPSAPPAPELRVDPLCLPSLGRSHQSAARGGVGARNKRVSLFDILRFGRTPPLRAPHWRSPGPRAAILTRETGSIASRHHECSCRRLQSAAAAGDPGGPRRPAGGAHRRAPHDRQVSAGRGCRLTAAETA